MPKMKENYISKGFKDLLTAFHVKDCPFLGWPFLRLALQLQPASSKRPNYVPGVCFSIEDVALVESFRF